MTSYAQPRTDGALATRPRASQLANLRPIAGDRVEDEAASEFGPRQRALFPEPPGPRIVPPAPNRARKPAPVNKPRRPATDTQTKFDFPSQPPTRKMLSTTVEATIYCEDPVATVWHRAIAAALDWSMVAIGYGVFVVIFHFLGGSFDLSSKINVASFVGMLALIGLVYGGMWTLAGRDSAGMRWAQLQITTFDGFPPEPRQRLLRFAGSCLSLCTLVGLLWSLADEESLTWQDHMSGTFPTPVPLDPGVRRD